jgi:hypothetical protein
MKRTARVSLGLARELERVEQIGAFRVTAHVNAKCSKRITKSSLFWRVSKGATPFSDHGSRDGALLAALGLEKGQKFLAKFPKAWWNATGIPFGLTEAQACNAVINVAKAQGCYTLRHG